MDVWGRIYRDHWAGRVLPHEAERDDGRVHVVESAKGYFDVPRNSAEREFLDQLEGPILDLAAGPGSYTLYLQAKGMDVTAADFSPGALQLSSERGCRATSKQDLRAVSLNDASFRSIIVMGNSLGLHQTPQTLPVLLGALRRAVVRGGFLLFTMIDPLDTRDEAHLAYHRRNVSRGLPPGLTRMRMRYDGEIDEWVSLWMLTQEEVISQFPIAGWTPMEERSHGPLRVRLCRAA
jgi:ubiquinone/menaquinone biosynthesis C-methylase UbiE